MPWQIWSPRYNGSQTIRYALQSLHSAKKPVRRSARQIRAINTAQSFLAAQHPDELNTEGLLQDEGTNDGQPIRKVIPRLPPMRYPEQVLHLRCVQLLHPNRDRSDPNGTNAYIDQKISVSGTIKSIRKQKHGAFAHVTDGSCVQPIQVVLDPECAAPLNNGTSLSVNGRWEASPAPGQAYELKAEEVHVNSNMDIENYPIQKKYQTPEFLRTIPHLRIRTPFNSSLARLRSACLSHLNEYFSSPRFRGEYYVQVQPPIITSSDCEGAGEVFTVVSNGETAPSKAEDLQKQGTPRKLPSFFRTPKYLTVSSQLHLEAYAAELRNVWALSPTFRAEKSDTPRHLAEFSMLEVEISHLVSLGTLTGMVEHLIRTLTVKLMNGLPYQDLIQAIRASGREDGVDKTAEEVEARWHALLIEDYRWKRATYSHCMRKLCEAAKSNPKLFEHQPQYGHGLRLEHERWIVENVSANRPIFVTHYPKTIKPFYMAPSLLARDHFRRADYKRSDNASEIADESETGEDTVACFDLLMPFGLGELAGGSLREHRLKHLIENMRENGMLRGKAVQSSSNLATRFASDAAANAAAKDNTDSDYPFLQPGESLGSLRWYTDLRRFGTNPHGGFGIGWDRLIAYLAGVHNLRDVVPFPRSFGKADC